MVTDPIADFLTRIRNAQMANHRIVEIPASKLKKRMTEILYDKGYIRPGLRQYASPSEFQRVKNGLGVAIISTSKGVMTDKEAKAQNVGGEVLCYLY